MYPDPNFAVGCQSPSKLDQQAMMVIQNAFNVFVCGRPHSGSMVVAGSCCSWAAPAHDLSVSTSANSYLNSIFVLSAPIQVFCVIIVADAFQNPIFVVFVVLEHYATTTHLSFF